MTERDRAKRREDATEEEAQDATSARGEEVADKIDDLLDEIDSVLEENAEEFVKNYVQKGGE
ncbi:MAG: ubiquitin-like protein Pup [Acidimicrobiia bacterium]